MADYDHWNQPCCGGFSSHKEHCHNHPGYNLKVKIDEEIAREHARGFVYLGMSGGNRQQMLWGCRRGCGAVVWYTDEHIKNVCTTYEKETK